jgi:hypothetical protein
MVYALAALAAVIGLIAFTGKTPSSLLSSAASKVTGKFTPVVDDPTLGNMTALLLVALPGGKDDEVSLSNAVFKAGLNIASLTEAQASSMTKDPGVTVARFGGKPVGILHSPLTGEINMPLLIQARMANPNIPAMWIVLVPQVPSAFSIPGYSVIATAPAGNL